MQELHVKSLLPVRLDKYLMEQFPALGPGRLNKALRENKIKLNGKKQPLATRVQNGDVIRVYLLDDQLGLTSQEGPEFLQARAPAEFIYENDDLIVANKPAGIPVDGDEADTLLNRVLRRLYEEKRWDAAHEPRLCHRLDTGTSGLVIIAKTPEAEELFLAAIKNRDVQGRIVLTLRELLGTWSENAACFAAGETVVGIVRSVEDYGVFIEIAPNLAGLAEADSTLRPGQAVSVYIKNILPDKMKIKLVVVNKNLGQPLRFEPHYFVTRGRLKRWTYSTPQSRKQIETVF